MKNDLLISLRKYRPRENSNPIENFLTEAFAWLLRNNSDFSTHFINFVSNELKINIPVDDVKWSTQLNFSGVYPDMVCEFGNRCVVFEHKVFAHLHENQLDNYRKYAQDQYDDYNLVLITANSTQHQQGPDLALCWSQIHELIDGLIFDNSNTTGNMMLADFNNFLVHEGLGPKAPISHESILYHFRANEFRRNLESLIKEICNTRLKEISALLTPSEFNLYYRNAWGRIGLELHNSWRPCIFIGVLSEWEDHRVKPLLGENSPDFVILLSFDVDLHKTYPIDTHYMSLVSELSTIQTDNEWQFYNHLNDDTIDIKNLWHPIYFRKPMLEVFRGTTTRQEQEQVFMDIVNKFVPYFEQSENFKNLRQKYSINKSDDTQPVKETIV